MVIAYAPPAGIVARMQAHDLSHLRQIIGWGYAYPAAQAVSYRVACAGEW
ncbi:hypothetical protein [Roseiflexus sp. RS-1]|nr:hypothetical protein [Roseiflexus sp. RS-1]